MENCLTSLLISCLASPSSSASKASLFTLIFWKSFFLKKGNLGNY